MDTFPYTERHLQAVWYDARFRPAKLTTSTGQAVVVREPGRWNLESGPDFLNAVLLVGSPKKQWVGDVEVHIHPGDWQRHGHHRNPFYNRVIAHVTYFGTVPLQPPGPAIWIRLAEALAENPRFSFDSIDITSYPCAPYADPRPCAKALDPLGPDYAIEVLEAAGMQRLKMKSERIQRLALRVGRAQALYESILVALGYKQNSHACRRLARLLPLSQLRDIGGSDRLRAYALLLGVAGLLPDLPPSRYNARPAALPRRLWDCWWRSAGAGPSMSRSDWKLAYVRPSNHPLRRLAAAAELWTCTPRLEDLLLRFAVAAPSAWLSRVQSLFQTPSTPCLADIESGHTRSRLIGPSRAATILTNAVVPWLMALGTPVMHLARCLPPESSNNITRLVAHNLLGPDSNPAIYHSGLLQQGLIQVFRDFCSAPHSRCENCRLARALAKAHHEGVST